MLTARQKAQHFLDREREFRLGALLTEQSHPKTVTLSQTIQRDTAGGIRILQTVDEDLLPVAERVLASEPFARLKEAFLRAWREGKRIFLSGCGATGRLCILLEAAWRRFWQSLEEAHPGVAGRFPSLEDSVGSVMTGGDYALIRSVESFEDYPSFGRHQILEAGVSAGDVVVAITEGGETSSVIGTAWQGLASGAEVFFVCNNPLDVLARHVERSRQIIEEPRITKLELASGPMALAGSTRMQATTSELLIVGAALESALIQHWQDHLSPEALETLVRRGSPDPAGRPTARSPKGQTPPGDLPVRRTGSVGRPSPNPVRRTGSDLPVRRTGSVGRPSPNPVRAYLARFAQLLADLSAPEAVEALARFVEFEEGAYRAGGAVTYLADGYLLDIFTDTTERSPTFMLPPFRQWDDPTSPRSWAFVKDPRFPTPEAWRRALGRPPRGLDWDAATYRKLGASEAFLQNPPRLDTPEVLKFLIGQEDDPSRYSHWADAAVLVLVGSEVEELTSPDHPFLTAFQALARPFPCRAALCVGPPAVPAGVVETAFHVPCDLPESPLKLWDHLALKLVLNTVSTATMARLGRVVGNWMAHVEPTNKKLIDRGTRLVAELAGVDYETACYALHETMEELAHWAPGDPKPSPVARTIERLKAGRGRKGEG